MILGLIFSKDRAMQLDAMLSSFLFHIEDASEIRLIVFFKTSTNLHQTQYDFLKQKYADNVEFVPEVDFRRQLLDILITALPSIELQQSYRFRERFGFFLPGHKRSTTHSTKVFFLVDDNIFVHPFSLEKILYAFTKVPNAMAFSLRLGTNTTYCYALDKPQSIPKAKLIAENIYKYDWTRSDGDFAYPLEVSSSIYPIEIILNLLFGLKFQNPNTLESQMAQSSSRLKRKYPMIMFYERSVTFCAPINRVQDVYQNRAGENIAHTSEHLAELFSEGKRINILSFSGFIPQSCHQEVELMFEDESYNPLRGK